MSVAVAAGVPTLEDARAAAAACGEVDENVEKVLLFGSVARGDAGVDSDIDLLVLVSGDIDGREGRLTDCFSQAARAAVEMSCDVTVRSVAQWEHLTANVLSSFEASVEPETVKLLHREPIKPRARAGNLAGVSKDDMDEAAKHGRGVEKGLDRLRSAISSLYYEEEIPHWAGADDEARQRMGRIQDVLSQSYRILELSIRSIGAAVGRKSMGSDHDILSMVAKIQGDVPEAPDARAAIYAILDRVRLPDGKVRNWHIDIYVGEIAEWVRDSTDQNARNHIEAALELALMAAAELESRPNESGKPAEAASWIRWRVPRVEELPYVRDGLDRPPG